MFRLYFRGEIVPNYLIKTKPQRMVRFGCLFTIIYKKRCDYYVNGFLGPFIISIDSCGVIGGFNLEFSPITYFKKII